MADFPYIWETIKDLEMVVGDVDNAVGRPVKSHWMLAGGFLRDQFIGLETKDIDLFIHTGRYGQDALAQRFFEVLGKPKSDKNGQDEVNKYADYSFRVLKFDTEVFDLPLHVILTTFPNGSPKAMLESFDFGLCQIGYSKGIMLMTEYFLRDISQHTCTMLDSRNKEGSIERYNKWVDRGMTHELLVYNPDNKMLEL